MMGFLRSTVGKKYLMGLSALVWAGFVAGHMAGNLLMFVSADAYNAYGHGLTSGKIIYVIEAILIAALITHVVVAILLTKDNKTARPSRYAVTAKGDKKSTTASRTMGLQGTIILVFIILHIATFKYGTIYETTVDGVPMRDLFRLVVEVFQSPGYVVWYCVALVILGFHLSHGVKSVFQSLGLWNSAHRPTVKKIAWAYGIVVAAGFLAQPIYVYFFAN